MISIVVPVYNVEKYIVKCLESIIKQSYQDYEIILVDDGCKDDSITLAQGFLLDKDVDYKVYRKENGGLSSARNYGLKKAKGEYVVFIDSDDVIDVDFLLKLHDAIDDCDFSFCNFKYIKKMNIESDEDSNEILFDKDKLMKSFLKRTVSFVVPSMMFKTSFLIDNNLFFNETVKFSEDQMFIWSVIFKMKKARYLNRQMYGYYIRDDSIMNSSSYDKIYNAYKAYCIFVSKMMVDYPENIDVIGYILPRWKLGTLYTSANLMNKDDYLKLYDEFDGKYIFKELKGFKEKEAYMLSYVSKISGSLLYYLCRKMNLNG